MLRFPVANFPFMRHRKVAFILSGTLLLLSLILLATRGLNFGVDFTGGTVIEVSYPDSVDLEIVRDHLEAGGYGRAMVQHFGTSRDVLIRLAPREGENSTELAEGVLRLLQQDGGAELRRVEFVGPQVGEELREKGGLAMLYTLIGILIYVALRFEWRLSAGAVLALAHDAIIVLGLLSLVYAEFDLTVLAALLAVIGYSLNDSIVISDRIRENFRRQRKEGVEEVMNSAINQTLSRTIITGLTTLLVLFALFFLGGVAMQGFALTLIVGVVVGTYSSIYIGSALALLMGLDRSVLALPRKETGESGEQV